MIRTSLIALAAAVATSLPALAAATVGQPAPAFTVTDSNGKRVSLADYRGRTVVLEWNNPACPFVVKHYAGNMQALQRSAKADGVVWLTLNSGAAGKQGHMNGAEANAYVTQGKAAPTAYLLDASGTVGRAYGATATPHMYVVSPKGTLVYAGAIDDRPTANPEDIAGARNYVTAALAAVRVGRAPDPAVTRAYGCAVKY